MSHEYTYVCKKTPWQCTFTTPLDMNAQDAYAWARGLREYMDNYHAACTAKGLLKGAKLIAWGTEGLGEFAETVRAYLDEARDRFNAGDVPGTRAPTDPMAAMVRKLVAELKAEGHTPETITADLIKKKAKRAA